MSAEKDYAGIAAVPALYPVVPPGQHARTGSSGKAPDPREEGAFSGREASGSYLYPGGSALRAFREGGLITDFCLRIVHSGIPPFSVPAVSMAAFSDNSAE